MTVREHLKFSLGDLSCNGVVPLVGTWLETACQLSLKMIQCIIPLAEI